MPRLLPSHAPPREDALTKKRKIKTKLLFFFSLGNPKFLRIGGKL
jgi:hypothetical protein